MLIGQFVELSADRKRKVKVWVLAIALLTWLGSWTAALYNLGSGSWLALASGTTAHYAVIHCQR